MNPKVARVFLMGCPRSGTTLAQSLLAGHPRVLSFPETHFFSALYTLPARQRACMTSHHTVPYKDFREWAANAFPSVAIPKFMVPSKYGARRFLLALDKMTISANKSAWIEKTPEHVFYADRIALVDPSALFFHIVRKPSDTISSLMHVAREYTSVFALPTMEECLALWKKCAAKTLQYSVSPKHIIVPYELMATDPSPITRHCLVRIGVDPAEWSGQRADPGSIALTNEPWKFNAIQGVIKPATSRAQDFLTSIELERIEQETSEVYANLLARAISLDALA